MKVIDKIKTILEGSIEKKETKDFSFNRNKKIMAKILAPTEKEIQEKLDKKQ